MKNLKNMLGLLAVLVFTFAAVGIVNAETSIKDGDIVITTEEGQVKNVTKWKDEGGVLKAIEKAKTVIIELKNDVVVDAGDTEADLAIAADQTVTIKLNGNTLNLGKNGVTIAAKGTLNVVGSGTLTSEDETAMFSVTGNGKLNVTKGVSINNIAAKPVVSITGAGSSSSNMTNVSFSKDTEVISTGSGVVVPDTAKYTKVSVAGDWSTKGGPVVEVTGEGTKTTHAAEITMLDDGKCKYEATTSEVVKIGGYANVTINGGTFTSDASDVITLNSQSILNIKGGNFKTETDEKYALNVTATFAESEKSSAKNVLFNISAGTFTSGTDSEGELLPAINIANEYVLSANEGHVTGGTFIKGISNTVFAPDSEDLEIAANVASNTLTKGATATTKNGQVVVKTGTAATDPEQKPEDKPNTGDNQPEENPKTFDAIGSLVALAVSSLGVVGTATKKVLR